MAEGGGLLNRYTAIIRIVGSNPIPSATYCLRHQLKQTVRDNPAIIRISFRQLFPQINSGPRGSCRGLRLGDRLYARGALPAAGAPANAGFSPVFIANLATTSPRISAHKTRRA